jgi:acyl-CoA dehydrogenase
MKTLEEHQDLIDLAEDGGHREFAREAITFLASCGPRRSRESIVEWGVGAERLALFEESTEAEEREQVASARAWQRTRWDAGFGWLAGPVEQGGRGLDPSYERLYRTLESSFETPDAGPLRVGLGTVGPPIEVHGTPEQVETYAGGIHRGDLIACQLFSEPGAGSDLAGVCTKGIVTEAGWKITGQKVWTSNAQFADVGLALVRTDPKVPKHQGITAFLIPMRSPGVEVRPLRQMTGGASFNEVFLNDVEVGDELRLGPVGHGWQIALDTLSAERGDTGDRSHEMLSRAVELLWQAAQRCGRAEDPRIRECWASVYTHVRVARYQQTHGGGGLGTAGRAVDKLLLVANLRRIGDLAREIVGQEMMVDEGRWGTFAWNRLMMGSLGYRIAGGTDEVLLGSLATRALGMPSKGRA